MSAARSLARSGLPRAALPRTTRPPHLLLQQQPARFQSSSSGSSSSHLASGLFGGLIGGSLIYLAYSYTPTGRLSSTINKTAAEASKKYKEAASQFQRATPDNVDQTIDYIRDFCYSYVAWIPGGKSYVDAAFKDVDTVRRKHKEEVDEILNDAYKQLQDVSKAGLSLEAVTRGFEVLADVAKKVGDLAADAAGDVLENHPDLKKKVGPAVDQLKQYGEQYGPEARKQVNETWQQVRDVLAGGLTAANFDKVRKLIEEKVQQVQKLGDEAWQKGMEQAKPLLEKNPKVKEMLEKNADALKQGNAKELFDRVNSAVESGDLGDLNEYVNGAVDKAKQKGSQYGKSLGLDKYFDMIPGGSEILPKLKQMKEVAEKHSEEGEKLMKETIEDIKQLLEKKSKRAEEIVEQAKKDAE